MNSLDELNKIYTEKFKTSFDKLNLIRYDEKTGPSTFGSIKFSDGRVKVKFLFDRGIIETEISPAQGEEQFRGIDLFYALIKLEGSDNKLLGMERRKVISVRLGFEDQQSFLNEYIETLRELLDGNSSQSTLNKVDELGKERFN